MMMRVGEVWESKKSGIERERKTNSSLKGAMSRFRYPVQESHIAVLKAEREKSRHSPSTTIVS